MAAYLIVNYTIDDTKLYEDYRAGGARAALRIGTESAMVVFDPNSTPLEGEPGTQTVMIRFDTRAQALATYHSDEYQAILGKRLGATSRHFAVVVDALDLA
jgi:uncharacterized protein (DUF1330 family)